MQELIKTRRGLLEIPALLKERQRNEVLFVTGHHLLQDRLFRELCEQLTVPYRVIHPPEGVLQVDAIPEFISIDTVIAIGGGKVIDFAKGIITQHPYPVFFMAAPTTAGSGSEATPIAVFYKGKEKVSLDAPQLLPAVAILDAALLDQLPKPQRAISGADALAQCIESVWNVHSNDASERFALEGLSLLWHGLKLFVEGGGEVTAEQVLWGAHLAGKAITITRTTGPHAFSYYLTAHHGVPHGQAVALTLPLFFIYNETEVTKDQLSKIYAILKVKTAQEAFTACRQLFKQIGLATSLRELGLEHIDLDNWMESVNQQRFANNPVPFNGARLKALFQQYL